MRHLKKTTAESTGSFSAGMRRETAGVVSRHLGEDDRALLSFLIAAAAQYIDGAVMFETSLSDVQELYVALLSNLEISFHRRKLKRRFTVTFSEPSLTSDWHRLIFAADQGDKRALCFAALFMATGSLSDPKRTSDLEFRIRDRLLASRIVALAETNGIHLAVLPIERGVRLYTKNRESIVDMILYAGAQNTYLAFQSQIVERELLNDVNRRVNCDQGNARRLADSSAAQLEAIRYIEETVGLEMLPEHLRAAAEARLQHPELTISELGALMQPPIGKSGMNHRLKKLFALYRECAEADTK